MNILSINNKMSGLPQFIRILTTEMDNKPDKKKFISEIADYVAKLVTLNPEYFSFMKNINEIKKALEEAKEVAKES
jgi:hypothetical protein